MAKRIARFLVGCVLVGAVGALLLVAMYGSVRAGLARLAGSDLLLLPRQVYVGNVAKDSDGKIDGHFTVKNLSGRSIIVSGARVDCGCVKVTSPLPFSLSGGEETHVNFSFEPPSDGTAVTQTVVLYTNSTADPELLAIISNTVKEFGL